MSIIQNFPPPLAAVFTATLVSSVAFAGGYRVSLQGQQSLGMAHTGVALTQSSESVFFNPAGIVFLESPHDLTLGVTVVDAKTKYQNQDTGASYETDNPMSSIPATYFTWKHSDSLAYGFGLYAPYGNTVTWPKDWPGSHLVNEITLKSVVLQPTISYKFDERFSVGLGLQYVMGNVEFNRNLNTSLSDTNGNRTNVTVEDGGVTAWGYNLGLLYKASEQLSLGLNYRSEVNLEARGGKATFANTPTSLQATYNETTFDADLVLPAELTLGLAYQVMPSTTITFEINRSYWSAYKELKLEFAGPGIDPSINPRNYKDANIYRLGIQHTLNPKWTLRGGIYHDKTPVQSGYFAPETPRNDSTGFTAGASYKVSKGLTLDASFLYLHFDEFAGSYDHSASGKFGGDYKSSAYTLGLGLHYTF